MYSTFLVDAKTVYYSSVSWKIGLVGLQLCQFYLPTADFQRLFLENFFFFGKSDKGRQLLKARAESETCLLVGDLFATLTEINCNEICLPAILKTVSAYSEELFGPGEEDVLPTSEQAVERFFKQYIAVMAPIPLKQFNKSMNVKFIRNEKLVETLMSAHSDLDKNTKLLKCKPALLEKLKKSGVESDLIWFDSTEFNAYQQSLQEKFPDNDPLFKLEVSTQLNKRLQKKMFAADGLKELLVWAYEFEQEENFSAILPQIFKYVLLCLANCSHDLSGLKSFFTSTLDPLLASLANSKKNSSAVTDLMLKKVAEIKKTLLKEELEAPASSQTEGEKKKAERERQEKLRKRFEEKKNKQLKRVQDRGKLFMADIERDSEKFVQGLSDKTGEEKCPITQEFLTSAKTYFIFCQTHVSNVSCCWLTEE